MDDILRGVAELAKLALDEVTDASLTVLDNGQPRTIVATGLLATDLDQRQYELGSGPCLDAAASGRSVVVDTGSDSSYPDFATIAARAGIRQIVSVGMPTTRSGIGGLNLYQTSAPAVTASFLAQASVLAAYAAIALGAAEPGTDEPSPVVAAP